MLIYYYWYHTKPVLQKNFCHMYWGIGDLKLKAVTKKITWFTIFAGGLHYWSGWNRLYISIGVGHRNHISEKLHQACKDQHWTVITLHACPLGRFCADQFLFLASKNLDRWDNNRRFIYITKTGKKSFHTKLILHWQWVNSEG